MEKVITLIYTMQDEGPHFRYLLASCRFGDVGVRVYGGRDTRTHTHTLATSVAFVRLRAFLDLHTFKSKSSP